MKELLLHSRPKNVAWSDEDDDDYDDDDDADDDDDDDENEDEDEDDSIMNDYDKGKQGPTDRRGHLFS